MSTLQLSDVCQDNINIIYNLLPHEARYYLSCASRSWHKYAASHTRIAKSHLDLLVICASGDILSFLASNIFTALNATLRSVPKESKLFAKIIINHVTIFDQYILCQICRFDDAPLLKYTLTRYFNINQSIPDSDIDAAMNYAADNNYLIAYDILLPNSKRTISNLLCTACNRVAFKIASRLLTKRSSCSR